MGFMSGRESAKVLRMADRGGEEMLGARERYRLLKNALGIGRRGRNRMSQ